MPPDPDDYPKQRRDEPSFNGLVQNADVETANASEANVADAEEEQPEEGGTLHVEERDITVAEAEPLLDEKDLKVAEVAVENVKGADDIVEIASDAQEAEEKASLTPFLPSSRSSRNTTPTPPAKVSTSRSSRPNSPAPSPAVSPVPSVRSAGSASSEVYIGRPDTASSSSSATIQPPSRTPTHRRSMSNLSTPSSISGSSIPKPPPVSLAPVEEAKAVAIMYRNPELMTRCEHDWWILTNMLRPITEEDCSDGDIRLFDVSVNSHHFTWFHPSPSASPSVGRSSPAVTPTESPVPSLAHPTAPQSPSQPSSPIISRTKYDPRAPSPLRAAASASVSAADSFASVTSLGTSISGDTSIPPAHPVTTTESVPALENGRESPPESKPDLPRRFLITPQTRICALAEKYRVVFMVDLSVSMSRVDVTAKAKVIISMAFETLCKCLDGMCRPFSVDRSLREDSYDVGAITPELYITILAECGSTVFRSEQNRLASGFAQTFPMRVLMQEVRLTRDNINLVAERLYDALNAYENDLVAERQKDPVFEFDATVGSDYLSVPPVPEQVPNTPEQSGFASGDDQSRPTASAANLAASGVSRTLEYGLFALGLLPQDSIPAMVLITDGISTANDIGSRDICRRIARDNIIMTIIQVGSAQGFTPSVNFGHVPDNELLRLLSLASFGKFLYSSDCRYLETETDVDVAPSTPPPPNFYHRVLLIRESSFAKSNIENRSAPPLTVNRALQNPTLKTASAPSMAAQSGPLTSPAPASSTQASTP
ncbi:hypothetical protein BDK51DRAFT_50233 [Blyttiomyces helicus]|uniref:Uncharacterized protein n=1 Tax=Blyttiomyces helicus TaxID=388810 RepID=A0A4P9WE52_9FUNG|nr:hypothetical protein BDK51DRAFT_50233 [Blyttiomyces helicus]|eukprot:RKO90864.1 hypothetical protein BDK51DRAFT_50233 [Blyttiomyces helicus]